MIYSILKILYHLLIKIRFSCVQGILVVIVFSALFSCTSLKKIGITVSVLPEFPIADDIQSLALLNRSMNFQFTNIKTDSLEKILIRKKMEMDTVFQDSIAADTVIQVAANALFESGRFDVVIPQEPNIIRTDTNEIPEALSDGFINKICEDFNVDGVLVLESFAERLNTKYYLTSGGESDPGAKEYIAATDITFLSDWRLYRPNSQKQVIRFQVGDSIFWNAASSSLEYLYFQMPRTKEALIGGGIAAGLKMSGYISPNWVNQSRYYYLTGNKEIDKAVPLIQNNKWDEAAVIWTKNTTANSKRVRGKVEFNLALAAEMNGDLDLAIEWGLKSYKTRYTKAIEVYLKTLDDKREAQQKENNKRF